MSPRPKIRLSRLRDIGWAHWDPIGLLEAGQSWKDEPFASEYDSYLLRVAGMVRNKRPMDEAVDYLVDVESSQMGLGVRQSAYVRAKATIEAIMEDGDLWS